MKKKLWQTTAQRGNSMEIFDSIKNLALEMCAITYLYNKFSHVDTITIIGEMLGVQIDE